VEAGDFSITLGGLEHKISEDEDITVGERMISDQGKVVMCACGTSWHSALIGEYLFEQLARIDVEVEYASEFRYRKPIIRATDVIIGVSQSGETADTLEAIRLAAAHGATTFGVVNVVGSTIARETDAGIVNLKFDFLSFLKTILGLKTRRMSISLYGSLFDRICHKMWQYLHLLHGKKVAVMKY